ncbi:MAG: GbsR/MarR family transcriptional regulator [Halanaerobiaceae bacterium]
MEENNNETRRLEEIRGIIIEAFGGSVGVYGMNETIGRIYGLLYLEDEALALQEIASHLGVSKATISINIRLLLELKMVHKVWQKGSRKDYYIAERDFEKIIQEALKNKELKQIVVIKAAIARAVENYNSLLDSGSSEETKEVVEKDLKKLEKLLAWVNKGQSWINFFLKVNIEEGPTENIQEIEIDWNDE